MEISKKAIEEFGNIIGELESWQHRYLKIEWIPQHDINTAKGRLIRILDNMEHETEPINP